MAEENQVMKEPQQVTKEPQQGPAVTKEPQRVTTKNPKKVEAGKSWLHTVIEGEKNRGKNKRNWKRLPAE